VRIEIFSDIVCPWCYAGFARLEAALAARPGLAADVHWLPFELNPDLPEGGMDRAQYMVQRFGDANRFAGAQQQLRDLGQSLGIDYRFERIARMPNTRRAHLLLAWARESGRQNEVKRALLAAYFTAGRDIGDPAVLAQVAAECGLDAAAARLALDDPQLRAEVEQAEAMGRGWGVSGVPTFIFDRRQAFSGAQPLEVFLGVIDGLVAAGEAGTVAGAGA
jgi:predicted DsbA family dithiol-disulfide isomerase